jgi:hypothetical protein
MSNYGLPEDEEEALSEYLKHAIEWSGEDREKIVNLVYSERERMIAAYHSQRNRSSSPIIQEGMAQAGGRSEANGRPEPEVELFVRHGIRPKPTLSVTSVKFSYIQKEKDSVPVSDWLEKASWWVPKNLREQFLGDLREDRVKMGRQGYTQAYIEWSTFFQLVVAILYGLCNKFGWALLIYNKVCDFLSPAKE